MNQRLHLRTIITVCAIVVTGMGIGGVIGGAGSNRLQVVIGDWDETLIVPTVTLTPLPAATSAPKPHMAETASPALTSTPLPPAPPTSTLPEIETPLPTSTPAPIPTEAQSIAEEPALEPDDSDDPTFIEYVVERGDILKELSQRFGTTNAEIIALNPGINPDSLDVGSTLRIPAPTASQ